MYRVPRDLNLSKLDGQFTTQICIGPFDLQFSIGDVHFVIQSEIKLKKNGEGIAVWKEGDWPSSEFYNVMNIEVESHHIPNDREIAITFKNGYSLHIYDNSDQYESMQIRIKGEDGLWVI